MGHRMELYISEKYAEDIIRISNSFGIEAKIIGYVEDSEQNELQIKVNNQLFVW
jgi:phosphoribosylformylglycinamidine cyclo-ligase